MDYSGSCASPAGRGLSGLVFSDQTEEEIEDKESSGAEASQRVASIELWWSGSYKGRSTEI